MKSLETVIKAEAKKAGYEACGIIKAAPFEEFMAGLEERSTIFPHAAPVYEQLKNMVHPKEKVPWAESIVVCLRRYDKYQLPEGLEKYIAKAFLFDGRLSYSSEYAGNIAFEQFLQKLDMRATQILMPARWAAVKAGLGRFRNNTFLYTQQGSWNWIDTWVVDKQLEYEKPIDNAQYLCPDNCNRCVKACPTGALSAPLTMDATRCISHLLFKESTSLPTEDLREKMGTCIYGCDACQNACPVNKWKGKEVFVEPLPLEDMVDLEKIFLMDEVTYRTKLHPRFWYIGKDNFWQWKCNVIRAMANEAPEKYANCFIQALRDLNENVREMAQWTLNKTGKDIG
ncbi:MAG: queG 2 [Caproiciproducens sp.]|nr:queG 2 [Caproiciproducens sp.]